MKQLLSIDLYRYKKDSTPLIGTIIAAGMLAMTIGMLFLMKGLSTTLTADEFRMIFAPKSTYIQGFQMANNAGLVSIIIIVIVTARDFTQNTLRLKILNGHNRTKIYLSTLFTNIIFGVIVVFVYSLLSLVSGILLFGYGSAFTVAEFFSLAGSTLMALIYVLLFISIGTAITMRFKTIGASIGITMAVLLGESILASLLHMLPTTVGKIPEWFMNTLNILPTVAFINIMSFKTSTLVTTIIILSGLSLLALVNFLGINSFKNSDIK